MHMPRKYASHPYWSWHGHQDGCRRRPAVAQPRFCHWTASQAISPPAHVTSGVGGGHRRRHGRCALSLRQILRRATLHVRHGTHMSHCPSSADTHSSLCHLFTHTSTQRHTVKSPLTPPIATPHCPTATACRTCHRPKSCWSWEWTHRHWLDLRMKHHHTTIAQAPHFQ